MRADHSTHNFSLFASSTAHNVLFGSSSSMNDAPQVKTVPASILAPRDTYSPSLLFTGFEPKFKRPASMIEPGRQHSFSSHLHPHKRTTLPRTSTNEPLALSTPPSVKELIDTAIPDEPSNFLSTSFESVDSNLSVYISSSPIDIPSKPTHSTQSTMIAPPTSPETCSSKPKSSSCPTEPSASSSSSSASPPSSSKRLSASGSASTRPLQFINKSGPPAPQPKPQQPTGVYVQTDSAKQQKARKQIREEGKVKRSSNCFIMYRTDMHPIIVARFGHQNNKEISRLAGRWWKNEHISVKNLYRDQAAKEKARHATLYPSYKYKPAKPAPKDDRNANALKSKARRPWNKPTQLSPPPAKHPSPSVSSPPTKRPSSFVSSSPAKRSSPSISSSPLLSLHEPGSTKDNVIKSAGDASAEYSSSPQVIKRNSPTTRATHYTSTSKITTKPGFVVTETALFDFKGNADLSEKKKSRSRTGPRSNRLNQRLPGLVEPLSLEISMEHASSTASSSPPNPFTFVLQGTGVPNSSFPAGPKEVSGLAQALAHELSVSQVTASSAPAFSRTPASKTPSGRSQLQATGITPQQQWYVPQLSPLRHDHALHATFLGNSDVLASDDKAWAQHHSPQPTSPFSTRLATNLVQSPQPSAPIKITVPSVNTTSLFSSSFDSPMYTPTAPSSASLGTDGFPWQLDANHGSTSDFGLFYTSGPLCTTPPTPSSTPVTTMTFQQGILSLSPVQGHPTLAQLTHEIVPSSGDDFASLGFGQELSSSLDPDDIFDDTKWNQPLQMPSPNVADLDQQLLLSASGCNSDLSLSTGSLYPDIAISTWTTLGESRVPSEFISNVSSPSVSISSLNDIDICDDNDNSCNDCTDIHDASARVDSTSAYIADNSEGVMVASQAVPMGGQPLSWGDEEQLKMSISYFEDIVQKQKMLLSLQRQWRQQAQLVQSPASSTLTLHMEL